MISLLLVSAEANPTREVLTNIIWAYPRAIDFKGSLKFLVARSGEDEINHCLRASRNIWPGL